MDDFAASAEVDHILSRGADVASLQRQGIRTRHDATGFSLEMPVAGDRVLEGYRERLHRLLGIDNQLGQLMRFRRYARGDSHPRHVDTYEIDGWTLIVTMLLFLDDTDLGGETRFPLAQPQPFSIWPRRGRLAVWYSALPDGRDDPLSSHEGCPVHAGLKTTLTYFVYHRRHMAAKEPDGSAIALTS